MPLKVTAFLTTAVSTAVVLNLQRKIHVTAESSASSFNLLRSRVDEKCGLMLVWGEIREGSATHVTGSEL